METFLVGLSLSATGGLAWLAYNCPKFAAKLLLGLLVCSMLIQIGLQTYQCGYRVCQRSISQQLLQGLYEFRLPHKKKIAMNNFIAAKIRNSTLGIDNTIEGYGFYLNMATGILLGLMLFAILIDSCKKTLMSKSMSKTRSRSR
jgi:hypothetical protein